MKPKRTRIIPRKHMTPRGLSFYRDGKGEIRWTFRAPNGRILADSGEGYKTLAKAVKGWIALMKYGSEVDIDEPGKTYP